MPIDGCSFIILPSAIGVKPNHSDSYICNPFTNEYTKLTLVNNKFPAILWRLRHNSNVTRVSNQENDILHFLEMGLIDLSLSGTVFGNYAFKIIVNLKLLTIEYINLLQIANSPLPVEFDLSIRSSNYDHCVRLNDHIILITGWKKKANLMLFDTKTNEYKRYKDEIPFIDGQEYSQGIVQRRSNEYLIWTSHQCLLLTVKVKTSCIKSVKDSIEFHFEDTNVSPSSFGLTDCSAYVKYGDFIICVEAPDRKRDREFWLDGGIFVCYLPTLKWVSLRNIDTKLCTDVSSWIISTNPTNGNAIINVFGWKGKLGTASYERMHKKLLLGIDDEMKQRIWAVLTENECLSLNLWTIIFDMIDDGIFSCSYKPYH